MLFALSFLESVESLYSSFGVCPPCAASEAEPARRALELQPSTHRKQASAADAMRSFMLVVLGINPALMSKELRGGRAEPDFEGRTVGSSKVSSGVAK